jgi:hypothetical protein
MHQNPRIRRLGLIRVSQPDEGVRRYLLARLDEISLSTPPVLDSPPGGIRHAPPARMDRSPGD